MVRVKSLYIVREVEMGRLDINRWWLLLYIATSVIGGGIAGTLIGYAVGYADAIGSR